MRPWVRVRVRLRLADAQGLRQRRFSPEWISPSRLPAQVARVEGVRRQSADEPGASLHFAPRAKPLVLSQSAGLYPLQLLLMVILAVISNGPGRFRSEPRASDQNAGTSLLTLSSVSRKGMRSQ